MRAAMFGLVMVMAMALAAAEAPRVLGPVEAEGRLLTLANGDWQSFVVLTDGAGQYLSRRVSRDGGGSWGPVEELTRLPEKGWGGLLVIVDRRGELQVVLTRVRGEGTKLAVDRFIDLWQVRTMGGQKEWTKPQRIFEGYVGSIQQMVQLRGGRILLPFAMWIGGSNANSPFGNNETTAVYSDDDGATWKLSPARLVAPVTKGFNGSNYGAVEPAVLERADGTLWMLMRTQTGFFYESTSKDGTEWTKAKSSGIRSSTGPPFLLRMPDRSVVLFWNHAEMPLRVDGQGVYGGRDALHAAVSRDEGKTWVGYREVYRDPYRHENPPKTGDRGTAYPYATVTREGKIALVSGQGAKRRALVVVDPKWLEEGKAECVLPGGFEEWTRFLGVGPAKGWWRERVVAAKLVDGALEVAAGGAAVWNFPMKGAGRMDIEVKGGGVRVELMERFHEPGDAAGGAFGVVLGEGDWRKVEFVWKGGEVEVVEGGKVLGKGKVGSVSYLRLKGEVGGRVLVRRVGVE